MEKYFALGMMDMITWTNGDLENNTLRLLQNGHHYPDDIFKCILFNKYM